MLSFQPFTDASSLNVEGLLDNIRRKAAPDRVYFMELFQDRGIEDAIDARCGATSSPSKKSQRYEPKRSIAMQRFLGCEYCRVALLSLPMGAGNTAANLYPSRKLPCHVG